MTAKKPPRVQRDGFETDPTLTKGMSMADSTQLVTIPVAGTGGITATRVEPQYFTNGAAA